MHPAQSSTLFELRHAKAARFSDLLKTTTLTSDTFKFHLRKLTALGLIQKTNDGLYELTARGKEFANRLDETTGKEIMQPKSSMLLVVRTTSADGEQLYLAHQRTREPFYGFWGIGSAPVLRGVPLGESAMSELEKQTGIRAEFHVAGAIRVIDKDTRGSILEDKLFSVMVADVPTPQESHDWHGGKSVWLTRSVLLASERLFPTTERTLDFVDSGDTFAETVCVYNDNEY